jgi:hypothetical protein
MKLPDSKQVGTVVSGRDGHRHARVRPASPGNPADTPLLRLRAAALPRVSISLLDSPATGRPASHGRFSLRQYPAHGPSFEPMDRFVQPARNRAVRATGGHAPGPAGPPAGPCHGGGAASALKTIADGQCGPGVLLARLTRVRWCWESCPAGNRRSTGCRTPLRCFSQLTAGYWLSAPR